MRLRLVCWLAAGLAGAAVTAPTATGSTAAAPAETELPVATPSAVHLANAASYDRAGFFGQDALFDDHGADTSADIYSLLSGFEGDAVGPGEETGVGDIRSVRVRPVPGRADAVDVDVTMNSLTVTTAGATHPGYEGQQPLHPVVFVGADTAGGGFAEWPHGAQLRSPGLDRGYTVTFDGFASVTTAGGTEPARATVRDHTVTVRFDDVPARPRFVVGAGEWDPTSATWRPQPGSDLRVLDLALSCDESLRPDITTPARDDAACEWRQAADLAAPETSHSWFTVDVPSLGRLQQPAAPPASGYASYVFESAVDNGDGYWRYTGNPQSLGRWQAFTVALPRGWDRAAHPLYVFLHGGGAWGTLQAPVDRFQSTVADSGRIVLYPYGRGPAPWWFPAAEADVFEAVAATERLFPVDPHRRVLSGISHGGYGTYLLGWSHPHLWSGLVLAMAANDNRYAVALTRPDLPHIDTGPLVANGGNTPVLMLAGTEQTQHEMQLRRDALASAGVEHTFIQFGEPLHGAKFLPDTAAHVVRWLDRLPPRTSRPRAISYTSVPAWFERVPDDPHRDDDGAVTRGRAWWLHDVAARSDTSTATVAALDERVDRDAARQVHPFGPEPAGEPTVPAPALFVLGARVDHGGTATGDAVRLQLTGVQSLTIDLAALQLPRGAVITVDSDGAGTVRAAGGRLCAQPSCPFAAGRTTFHVR